MIDSSQVTNREPSPCSIRRLTAEDIGGAAALHRIVFPDYFLTHMGQWFVEQFYSEFVEKKGHYGFVAVCGKELVGSVIGTGDSERLFRHFYRRHFPRLAVTLGWRIVVDPYIRRNLVSRIGHMRQAFRSLGRSSRQVGQSTDPESADQPPVRLLSIGVRADWRGTGIAEQLVDRYCEELRHDGLEWVGLSVRPENQPAIAFYEKTGWQRTAASATAVQYTHSTRKARSKGDMGHDR